MNKISVFLRNVIMIFAGPFWQFLVRLFGSKYDKEDNIREAYMEKVNDAIPEFTVKFVDKILDIIYPPEKHEFGLCHRIWNTEKLIYALLWYKWYSPDEIYSDTYYD